MKFLDRVEERTRLMKLLNGADGALALSELKAKAARLPFARNYQNIIHRLFVAKGGSYECLDLRWAERESHS